MAVSYHLGPQGQRIRFMSFLYTSAVSAIRGSWNLHRLDLPFTSCVFQASHVAALGLSVFICRMEIIIRILLLSGLQ